MTRERAIQLLEYIKFFENGALGRDATGIALDMAIAALREQPRWISVEDEKPKRRGHYFVAYKFPDSDMRFYGEAMWHDDAPDNGYVQRNHFSYEGFEGMYVTHWMKIPKLPEPQKEEV